MSVNTSQLVCACFEDATRNLSKPTALRGLTRLNVLLTSATENDRGRYGGVQSLIAGRNGGTILSSKRAKKGFSLSGSGTSVSVTWLVFFLYSVISCRPCHTSRV